MCIRDSNYSSLAFAALGAAFLGAALGAGVGAGAGDCVFSHCSGKFIFNIDCMRDQDPNGLLATIYQIGLSSAALYSSTVKTFPFSAK